MPQLLVLAFLYFAAFCHAENSNSHSVSLKIENDNNKINICLNVLSIECSESSQEPKYIELFEDNFDDDDNYDSFSSFSKSKRCYNYLNVLKNTICSKIGFSKTLLFILFCSLKLPFIS